MGEREGQGKQQGAHWEGRVRESADGLRSRPPERERETKEAAPEPPREREE